MVRLGLALSFELWEEEDVKEKEKEEQEKEFEKKEKEVPAGVSGLSSRLSQAKPRRFRETARELNRRGPFARSQKTAWMLDLTLPKRLFKEASSHLFPYMRTLSFATRCHFLICSLDRVQEHGWLGRVHAQVETSCSFLIVSHCGLSRLRPFVVLILIISGPAASSRLRLFEVIPCHVMFLV